ncbi:hypothetical protein [Phenylobacterium deserti]|uniref:Lipoprotein n=1 Tax=Phenylobacterium deserti TaxID=1914756 RepID=A0A328ADN6_9CAUL|nr:hypothetical protein [Phenylobacterium deserti]RAK52695.1 hypothetical protein DJ018_10895 [Phenylobacterium deserti]
MTKPVLVFPVLISLAGCATLTQGTSQEIAVVTPGVEGAHCVITDANRKVATLMAGNTRAKLSRGRRPLMVRCEKAGFQPGVAEIKASMSSRSRVQAPLGYAVDGLSGAMWSYPAEVTVTLSPSAG